MAYQKKMAIAQIIIERSKKKIKKIWKNYCPCIEREVVIGDGCSVLKKMNWKRTSGKISAVEAKRRLATHSRNHIDDVHRTGEEGVLRY